MKNHQWIKVFKNLVIPPKSDQLILESRLMPGPEMWPSQERDGWTDGQPHWLRQIPLLAPPKRSHCDDVRDFLNIKRPWIEKYLKLELSLFTVLTYGEIFSATRWNQRSLYLGLAQDSVISGFELLHKAVSL